MGADLDKFIPRWEGSSASEQQTKDQFLLELCDELGVRAARAGERRPVA